MASVFSTKGKKAKEWESLSLEELQGQYRRALSKLVKKDKQIHELRELVSQLENEVADLQLNVKESQRKVESVGFSIGDNREMHSESVFGIKLVLKEGWLMKRGRINKTYKRRFCVLKSDFPQSTIVYFKHRKTGVSPSGEIVIAPDVSVEKLDDETEGFPFALETPKRTYTFLADSEESRDEWLHALYSLKS